MNKVHAKYSSVNALVTAAKGRGAAADPVAKEILSIAQDAESGRSRDYLRGSARDEVLRLATTAAESAIGYSLAEHRFVRGSAYYALALRCKADGDETNARRFLLLSSLATIEGNLLADDESIPKVEAIILSNDSTFRNLGRTIFAAVEKERTAGIEAMENAGFSNVNLSHLRTVAEIREYVRKSIEIGTVAPN